MSNLVMKFSRSEVRSKVVEMINEMEAGVQILDAPPEGAALPGPVDQTGVAGVGKQAAGALRQLATQCDEVGIDGSDYEDMAADIDSELGLSDVMAGPSQG